jgi:radical SAM protein with 4Fe4S-binding SPASM domain
LKRSIPPHHFSAGGDLKIGEYLSLDAQRKERLKRFAVFSLRKKGTHLSDSIEVSPFDRMMHDCIIPQAYQAKKEGTPFPRVSMVHLSRRCNHSCPGCFYGRAQNENDVFLAAEKFPQLFKYLHSLKVKFILLGEGGEDTLHPKFKEFTRRCIEEGFKLNLLTNAGSISAEVIQLLVRAFSIVRVALDASEERVYNSIHRPANHGEFEKVLKNLDSIVAERNRRKSNLVLGAEIRLCQANMNFTEQTVQLARDIGLDYLEFSFERNDSDSLLPDQEKQTRRLIRELKSSFHPFPIYENDEFKRSEDGCAVNNSLLVITPSGDAYTCPHFHRRSDITSLGNIFRLPPEELWCSDEKIGMARLLSQRECHIKGCRWRITL